MIRDANPETDAARLAEIYNHYVLHDTATFELDPVPVEAMGARVARVHGLGLPWIVAEDADGAAGFAYAAPYRERAAYAYTLETTVYLDVTRRRQGLGTALYRELLARLRALPDGPHAPVHSLIAGIALPHPSSVALHESIGFEHVGTIRDAGRKFDRWIDVGFWQLALERD